MNFFHLKNKIILYPSVLIFFICSFNLGAQVTISWQGNTTQYRNNIPLVEVLSTISNQDVYWPAAALYKTDPELELVRSELLTLLHGIYNKTYEKNKQSAQGILALHTYVKGWNIAKRSSVVIDYDLSRLYLRNNPTLDLGHYYISAGHRQTNIEFLGATKRPFVIPHLPETSINSYPFKLERSNLADRDFVYLISPNGASVKAPIAYWNRLHIEPMPGSVVYVPFRHNIFNSDYRRVNELMVLLLKNRVVSLK
jgi:hypothetical protein